MSDTIPPLPPTDGNPDEPSADAAPAAAAPTPWSSAIRAPRPCPGDRPVTVRRKQAHNERLTGAAGALVSPS